MDKFNSFASQARAKADEGRVKAMARVDQYQASRSGGTGAAAAAGDDAAHAPSPPPAPASRARAGSSNAYNSSRTPTTNAPSSSVFVGIDAEQKHAFFSLLDEYFDSRPQYRDLLRPNDFGRTTTTTRAADVPAAASRPAPPPRKTTTTTQAPGLGMARALYDYDATTADDLAFREGDRITVLEHISEDWWRGELHGRKGMFPVSYVEKEQ